MNWLAIYNLGRGRFFGGTVIAVNPGNTGLDHDDVFVVFYLKSC